MKRFIVKLIEAIFKKVLEPDDFAWAACIDHQHYGAVYGTKTGHTGELLREMKEILKVQNPEMYAMCFGKDPETDYIR